MKKAGYTNIHEELHRLRLLISSDPVLAVDVALRLAIKVENTRDITLKSDVYHAAGLAFHETGKFDKALFWYKDALELRRLNQNGKGEAATLNNMGLAYFDKGSFQDSIPYYQAAIKLKIALGDGKSLAATYTNLGGAYEKLADYKKAMEAYYKSLKISEESGDHLRAAIAYQNMGLVHHLQGDFRYALRLYYKARKLEETGGDKKSLIQLDNNIGLVLHKLKKYDAALACFEQCLILSKSTHYTTGIIAATHNIGVNLKLIGRLDEALNVFLECMRLAIAENEYSHQCATALNIGEIYLLRKNYNDAAIYLKKAQAIVHKIGDKNTEAKIYQVLSDLNEATGNYAAALKYYRKYDKLRNSITNAQRTNQINQLQTQYEVAKKEELVEKARVKQVESDLKALQVQSEMTEKQKQLEIEHLRNVELKREKDRSEGLLLNILPAEVAEELKEKGAAGARLFDNVTVLFTDFKDFTKAAERFSPQQLVDELHVCFSAFDNIMEKYGIEKIKTVGDAYLAVSGLPMANRRHAQHVAQAAIEIRNFMLRRKRESGKKKFGTFEVRIGIHTGSVVAGIVGVKKFAYDIWGDTVNTAARMEQNGEAGKINISATTYELVKRKFKCQYRGEIEAKNKGKLRMYFLENLR